MDSDSDYKDALQDAVSDLFYSCATGPSGGILPKKLENVVSMHLRNSYQHTGKEEFDAYANDLPNHTSLIKSGVSKRDEGVVKAVTRKSAYNNRNSSFNNASNRSSVRKSRGVLK